MYRLSAAFLLLISICVLSGCDLPEGYHRDSSNYYGTQPSGYSGGHGGHH